MALMCGLDKELVERMVPYNNSVNFDVYQKFIRNIISSCKRRQFNFFQNTEAARKAEVNMKEREKNGGQMRIGIHKRSIQEN
jgi:hypothetical protein